MSYNTDLFVITYHDDYVEIRDFKMQRIDINGTHCLDQIE